MNTIKISFSVLLTLFLFACSEPAPKEPLIERNEEVREYFDVLTELIDEYANLVENMADDAIALEEKEEHGEEVTVMDGLSFVTDMVTSGSKIYELSQEIEGMEEQQKDFEENLSAEDFQEFLGLYTKTIKRFTDLAEKLDNK